MFRHEAAGTCYNLGMAATITSSDHTPSRRLPAGRKADLAAFVAEVGQVTVKRLADRFGVSSDTIRRDLDQLDADGLLVRTHGGAVSLASLPRTDAGLNVRLRLQTEEKETIAGLAADLVDDGSVILVNAGTTALALARQLCNHRDLTIATNNLRFPAEIAPEAFRDLYVFGGSVRAITQATTGPVAFQMGSREGDVDIQADLALVAVGAVSADGGYSTSNLGDAGMMSEMMARSRRVAILADSTKFGRRLFAQVADLDEADYLVTDQVPDAELAEVLAEAAVEIVTPGGR